MSVGTVSHVCVTVRVLASLCVRACMCLWGVRVGWGVELVIMCVCDYHSLLNLFHAEKA